MAYKFDESDHEIDLMAYVPDVLKTVLEFSEIMRVETPEFQIVHRGYASVFADQYIHDATDNGIKRWEKILEIPTRVSEPMEDRKFRILAKMNQSLPYTEGALRQMLKTLTGGPDEFSVNIDGIQFLLTVRVALSSKSKFKDVGELLRDVTPANLVIDLDLKYNQHLTLEALTHEQLSSFTHQAIYDEYLFGGRSGYKNKKL